MKLIVPVIIVLGANAAWSGAYEGDEYDDVYMSRSAETAQYERIFEAGKANGTTIVIQNEVVEADGIIDLSNPDVITTNKLPSERVLEPHSAKDMPTQLQIPADEKLASTDHAFTAEDFTDVNIVGRGGLMASIDIADPDKVKNEWVSVDFLGANATTISSAAASLMPLGWRIETRYRNSSDRDQKYDFSVSDHRDSALIGLLEGTGYEHQYHFESISKSGSASPILIIYPAENN